MSEVGRTDVLYDPLRWLFVSFAAIGIYTQFVGLVKKVRPKSGHARETAHQRKRPPSAIIYDDTGGHNEDMRTDDDGKAQHDERAAGNEIARRHRRRQAC